MTTANRNSALEPRQFIKIKPLPTPNPCGNKLRTRKGSARYTALQPTREHVSWENHRRRQRQLNRQGYRSAPWRPYGEAGQPLPTMEPKRQILEALVLQHVEESLPSRRAQAGRREDSVSLRRHLGHARRLVSAVKQGRGYFHLLQKEEQEEEARQRRGREEQLRAEPRPPCFSSDSDGLSDGWPLTGGAEWSCGNGVQPCRKKAQSARPFTPVHRSLTSPLLSEAPPEAIYRQLCCLNWLLEALTVERSGRAGPFTSCWDPKDPGRGRTTPKTLNKERAIETKWEQFISKPLRAGSGPQAPGPRLCHGSSDRLCLLRKSSSLSMASAVGSSLSSLDPGAEEDTGTAPGRTGAAIAGTGIGSREDTSTAPPGGAGDSEAEAPTSEYLRTLLDAVHESVRKELYGSGHSPGTSTLTDSLAGPQFHRLPYRLDNPTSTKTTETPRPKSCPVKPQSATSLLIRSKASMLEGLKSAYEERAVEMTQSYADILEHNARRRLDSGLMKFRALRHMTHSSRLPRHVIWPSVTAVKAPGTEVTERSNSNNDNHNNNNMWLSTLLSSLPAEVCRERAVSRVLEKLRGFADEWTPRVRPRLFLKVLGGLQPWELCLPDLCVAIEIAREHVVQMPREEYDSWLSSRVTLPLQDCHVPTHSS